MPGVRVLMARAFLRALAPARRESPVMGPLVPLAAARKDHERPTASTAAVFVAYFPDRELAGRVAVTSEQVDRVYVVDNTPGKEALSFGAGVEIIHNGRNLGVATALNQGAERALADGHGLLLMMDQDSVPRPGMVAALRSALRGWHAPVAIASPVHLDPNLTQRPGHAGGGGELTQRPDRPDQPDQRGGPASGAATGCARSMLITMTAGSLLDLRAYEALGGFRDDLFIDQVDHEYCLRAHRHGYDVLQVEDALIDHALGERSTHHLGTVPVVVSNHSSLRRYYITRNRLIVAREYPDFPAFRRLQRAQTAAELRDIVLFEDHKLAKLRMMVRGVLDFRRHRTGALAKSNRS